MTLYPFVSPLAGPLLSLVMASDVFPPPPLRLVPPVASLLVMRFCDKTRRVVAAPGDTPRRPGRPAAVSSSAGSSSSSSGDGGWPCGSGWG